MNRVSPCELCYDGSGCKTCKCRGCIELCTATSPDKCMIAAPRTSVVKKVQREVRKSTGDLTLDLTNVSLPMEIGSCGAGMYSGAHPMPIETFSTIPTIDLSKPTPEATQQVIDYVIDQIKRGG